MDKLEFAELAEDIFESIGGLVITDEEGKIIYFNRNIAKRMGCTPEESMGKDIKEVLTHSEVPGMLVRARREDHITPETVYSSIMDSIRSRLVIYRGGNAGRENVRGVVAFDILDSKDGEEGRSGLVSSMERMFLQNEMYREHIAEMYTARRDPDEILGSSRNIRTMTSLIRKVAPSSATVCILGETGTGKELVANAIHKLSKRSDKPFVKINCAAIPKDLMESELFGYEPGAFTGASRQGKLGRFELANGGTLLLDEIGEMPVSLQAKLLRVIQSQEVERVGGTTAIPIDVRLICSTNRDLLQMVKEGEFRPDLYYRINTMEIKVPSLRARKEDIPQLAANFLRECNEKNGLSVTGIAPGASRVLMAYDWPGNVRELENTIERACILCGSGELDVRHFTSILSKTPGQEKELEEYPAAPAEVGSFGGVSHPVEYVRRPRFAERERQMLITTLDDCGGNVAAAARHLGIARSTLYAKLKKYSIKEEEYRPDV